MPVGSKPKRPFTDFHVGKVVNTKIATKCAKCCEDVTKAPLHPCRGPCGLAWHKGCMSRSLRASLNGQDGGEPGWCPDCMKNDWSDLSVDAFFKSRMWNDETRKLFSEMSPLFVAMDTLRKQPLTDADKNPDTKKPYTPEEIERINNDMPEGYRRHAESIMHMLNHSEAVQADVKSGDVDERKQTVAHLCMENPSMAKEIIHRIITLCEEGDVERKNQFETDTLEAAANGEPKPKGPPESLLSLKDKHGNRPAHQAMTRQHLAALVLLVSSPHFNVLDVSKRQVLFADCTTQDGLGPGLGEEGGPQERLIFQMVPFVRGALSYIREHLFRPKTWVVQERAGKKSPVDYIVRCLSTLPLVVLQLVYVLLLHGEAAALAFDPAAADGVEPTLAELRAYDNALFASADGLALPLRERLARAIVLSVVNNHRGRRASMSKNTAAAAFTRACRELETMERWTQFIKAHPHLEAIAEEAAKTNGKPAPKVAGIKRERQAQLEEEAQAPAQVQEQAPEAIAEEEKESSDEGRPAKQARVDHPAAGASASAAAALANIADEDIRVEDSEGEEFDEEKEGYDNDGGAFDFGDEGAGEESPNEQSMAVESGVASAEGEVELPAVHVEKERGMGAMADIDQPGSEEQEQPAPPAAASPPSSPNTSARRAEVSPGSATSSSSDSSVDSPRAQHTLGANKRLLAPSTEHPAARLAVDLAIEVHMDGVRQLMQEQQCQAEAANKAMEDRLTLARAEAETAAAQEDEAARADEQSRATCATTAAALAAAFTADQAAKQAGSLTAHAHGAARMLRQERQSAVQVLEAELKAGRARVVEIAVAAKFVAKAYQPETSVPVAGEHAHTQEVMAE